MNDTVATEDQKQPVVRHELELANLIGIPGRRTSSWPADMCAAPPGRTYDRSRPNRSALSDRLVGFARANGIDAVRCVAINEVLTDGTIHNDSARLWPQTERLKAALTRLRRTGDPAERDEAVNAYGALSFYWATPVKGDGTRVEEPAPAVPSITSPALWRS
jgi:hypothetical protein